MTVLTRARALCAGLVILFAGCAAQQPAGRIPNFAPTDRVSWYPDRLDGDNWLPPEDGGPGPIVSSPEYPYVPNDASDQPTYRIADVSNPILQPWVRARMERDNKEVLAGKIPFVARERCYPPGPVAWNVFRRVTPPMVFFVQQPTFVLLAYRGDNQFRHVYLHVPHSPDPKPSWNGESVGHYENGDTLVMETRGFKDETFLDATGAPHTDRLETTERIRRIGPTGLESVVAIHDPEIYSRD